MDQMVGFRAPGAISMIPASRFGHLHLCAGSVASAPRLSSVNWERSLMRSQGIWRPGYGVRVESKGAGRSGAGLGVWSGGEFTQASGARVWNGMDCVSVPLLDQYLLRELVPPLVIAVGICATLGMSLGALVGLVREVVVSGLPLRVAGAAAMLQLPYFAAASMPMACLAASLFGLGRLQSDMESVALFAAGVPLWRMLLTPLCLCFVGAILKLACHNCVVPYELGRWLRQR